MRIVIFAASIVFLAVGLRGALAEPWETFTERNDFGNTLSIVERVGDGGFLLTLVCYDQVAHVEVVIPDEDTRESPGVSFLFSTDGKDPIRIGGFIERVEKDVLVFIGRDIKDRPAAATPKLVEQIRTGNYLQLLANDDGSNDFLSVEEWSLKGSARALKKVFDDCPKVSSDS